MRRLWLKRVMALMDTAESLPEAFCRPATATPHSPASGDGMVSMM